MSKRNIFDEKLRDLKRSLAKVEGASPEEAVEILLAEIETQQRFLAMIDAELAARGIAAPTTKLN